MQSTHAGRPSGLAITSRLGSCGELPLKWLFPNLWTKHTLRGLPDRLVFLGDISNTSIFQYLLPRAKINTHSNDRNFEFQTANTAKPWHPPQSEHQEKGERSRGIHTQVHSTRAQYPSYAKAAGCSTKTKHGTPEPTIRKNK